MAALGKIIGSVKTNAFAFGNGSTALHVHFLVYHSQHSFWGKEVHIRSWFCLVDICNSVANATGRFICAKISRELFSVWKKENKQKSHGFSLLSEMCWIFISVFFCLLSILLCMLFNSLNSSIFRNFRNHLTKHSKLQAFSIQMDFLHVSFSIHWMKWWRNEYTHRENKNNTLLLLPNPIRFDIHTQNKTKTRFKDNWIEKPNTNKLFTARFTGLWRSYKIPETISKSAYQRLKGAYMGYNSFDDNFEDWPEARWGNEIINTIKLHSFYHFNFINRFAFHFHIDRSRSINFHSFQSLYWLGSLMTRKNIDKDNNNNNKTVKT